MGQTFESVAPATGEVLGSFPRSTAADVDRAVAKAKAAFEDWRLVPAPERGNILFRFAELLRTHKDELTDLMTREMGKVKAEAGGEVDDARGRPEDDGDRAVRHPRRYGLRPPPKRRRTTPRRSSSAVRTMATRESGSSVQSTGTSCTRRPARCAKTRSSVSKNQV